MRKMNPEVKALVLEAARSGKYKQGTGALNRRKPHEKTCYCFLGLVCELAVEAGIVKRTKRDHRGYVGYVDSTDPIDSEYPDYTRLPRVVHKWSGLTWNGKLNTSPVIEGRRRGTILELNDGAKLTFEQIADIVEEQL